MTHKLVDGDFLAKLLSGSFELAINRVDEMVTKNAELFGGDDKVNVTTIGTFPGHAIVANSDGEFFRVAYSIAEGTGETSPGLVERIDVPVREASSMAKEARESADAAVRAMVRGDSDAATRAVTDLMQLVQAGVRLTAEAVEDALSGLQIVEADWVIATRDNDRSMRLFVGAEANRSHPQPRYEHIGEASSDVMDKVRTAVAGSLVTMKDTLRTFDTSLALARQVNESYTYKGSDDNQMGVVEFVEFVSAVDEGLQSLRGVIDDAVAISADGNVGSLARIHDGVAAVVNEMGLATAFCEKVARRFDAPSAAA